MTLVEQLIDIYYESEWWNEKKLDRQEAWKYHDKLLRMGNIITVQDGDTLCGYGEYWRLSFEQFGRIICGEHFSAFNEDVQTGQIAYVANVYVKPEYRKGTTIKLLRNRFYEINQLCTHFVGEARRKRSEPVKVFKRESLIGANKLEEIHG